MYTTFLQLFILLFLNPSHGLRIAGSTIPLTKFSSTVSPTGNGGRRVLSASDPGPNLRILRTKDRPDRVLAVIGTGTYLVSPGTFIERKKNRTRSGAGPHRILSSSTIPPGQAKKQNRTDAPTTTSSPTTGVPTLGPTLRPIPPGQEKKQNKTSIPTTSPALPTPAPTKSIPPGQAKQEEQDWLAAIGRGRAPTPPTPSIPGQTITNAFVDGKAKDNPAHAEGWEEDSYAEFIPEYKYDPSIQYLTSFIVKTYMGRDEFNHTGCTSEPAGYGRFYMDCPNPSNSSDPIPPVPEIANRTDVLWISEIPKISFKSVVSQGPRIADSGYNLSSPGPENPLNVLSSGSGDEIREIIFGANHAVDFGFGEDTVAIFSDTSIDPNHCSLYDSNGTVLFGALSLTAHRKIVGILNAADAGPTYSAGEYSHAELTTSTALGFPCVGVQGVASKAKLVHIDLSPPGTESLRLPPNFFSLIVNVHLDAGALVHSASWMVVGDNGKYTDFCYSFDMQSFQYQNLLHVYAGGNDGPTGISGVPASAKNTFSVGATLFDPRYQAYFSSTGLMIDGRRKPDVMAPGWNVFAAAAIPNSTPGYAAYIYASGTSLATPPIAATSLILEERFKILNPGGLVPCAALRMATMLAHAVPPHYVALDSSGASTISGIPITTYGTPMISLPGMFDMMNGVGIPLSSDPTLARLVRCYTVSGLSSPSQFDVAAVWMDVPGYPLTSPEIVNDVDIVLATDIEGVVSQDGVNTREVLYSFRAEKYIRFVTYVYGNVVTEGPVNVSVHMRVPPGASLQEVTCAGTCLPGDELLCNDGVSIRLCQANGSYSPTCYSRTSSAITPPPTSSPGQVNQTSCTLANAHAAYIYTYPNGTKTGCIADYCVSGYYMTDSGACACVPGTYATCAAAGSYAICQADTGDYSTCSSRAADDYKQSVVSGDTYPRDDARWGLVYKLAFTIMLILVLL